LQVINLSLGDENNQQVCAKEHRWDAVHLHRTSPRVQHHTVRRNFQN